MKYELYLLVITKPPIKIYHQEMEREKNSSSMIQTEKKTAHRKSPTKTKKQEQGLPDVSMDQKTLLCEMTRIRGQQKLLYLKQAKQKKYSDEKFFQNYPYCKMQIFSMNIQALKQNGIVFRDDNGLHWIQEISQGHQCNTHKEAHPTSDKKLLNGWGISILDDGKIFEGVYHDSAPCGIGYELLANGNTYVGGFKSGTKVGKGTYYWFTSNEMYSGDWLGGLPHGRGKYLSNNDLYEGNFCNGMKYGHGEEIFQNGDKYVGQYINGVADGYGEYFWGDGSVYKGDFKHGVRHGYGIWEDHKKTEIFSGCYRMDKKEGFGVYEWVNKQTYKGQFRQDYRQGYGRLYQKDKKFAAEMSDDGNTNEQKIIYNGMWMKGKQKSDIAVDEQAQKELDRFITQKKLGSHKKHRVGHQNCVPKQF